MPLSFKPLPAQSELLLMFAYDPITGVVTRKAHPSWPPHWIAKLVGKPVGWLEKDGYLYCMIRQERFRLHRIIWCLMSGEDPGHAPLDHIDRNRSNNVWTNLRLLTASQSAKNRGIRSNNTTGEVGVTVTPHGKFRAVIKCDYKSRHLGYFDSLEDAAAAYKAAAVDLHGKFAAGLS